MTDMSTSIGGLALKNPVIAASCEMTMDEAGIVACIDAGAAAVVAKSISESREAARQLDIADYVLLDDSWAVVPWASSRGGESLFCRSGLAQTSLIEWCAMLERCQRHAAEHDAAVIGSVTVAGVEAAAEIARMLAEVVPAIELNIGAPHGREAAAISQLTDAAQLESYVRAVRLAIDCPLIVKLSGQASDVVGLARAALASGADAVTLIARFNGFMPDIETWDPVLGSWGAIGGGWSLPLSLYWVSKCYRELEPTTLIGTNGARNGGDVVRFMLSGASAVELASLLFTAGPSAIAKTLEEVDSYLTEHGISEIATLIGASARRARRYSEVPPTGTRRPWVEARR